MAIARGYAATDASKPLAPFTFERREPRDDDVVIDIQYCGVCHSDIHQARNEWGNSTFPMVPGHEIVGIVRAVGSKVTKFKRGDRVG
ncbi:MAG: alcohol dehydrogenase catalytic domain-containing protein, partial [Sinorhizobium fredii]|nr:alcohol dehydrogenase catalytic domain-containing protein [Sinorhizobium fredii]